MNSEEGVRGGISIHRACHQRPYSSSSSTCGDRTSRNGVAGGACGHRHLTRGSAARRQGRCRLPMVGGLPVGQGSLTSEWRWAVEADRDGDAAGTMAGWRRLSAVNCHYCGWKIGINRSFLDWNSWTYTPYICTLESLTLSYLSAHVCTRVVCSGEKKSCLPKIGNWCLVIFPYIWMVDIIFTVCGELGNTVFTFGYKRIVSECVSYLIRRYIALSRFDRNWTSGSLRVWTFCYVES